MKLIADGSLEQGLEHDVAARSADGDLQLSLIYLSIAISLKRIADAGEEVAACVNPRDQDYPAEFRVRR